MAVIQPFAEDLLVSDHAVVRWLERVCGADIEAVRAEIRAAYTAGGGHDHLILPPTEAGHYVDVPGRGVHLVMRNFQIVTVHLSGKPVA